jgi:hypothetical protein
MPRKLGAERMKSLTRMRGEGSRPAPGAAGAQAFTVRPEHVAALAGAVLQKSRAAAVAIRVAGPWSGGTTVTVAGEEWPVVYCPSSLAVREALAGHGEEGSAPLILLTPVAEDDLGWDVRARLAKFRVIEMEPWGVLLDLFRARSVDPRIARLGWLAEALLENMPASGYPPAPSGVLDADSAWAHVLGTTLGLTTGRPDAAGLLAWSAEPTSVGRYERLSQEARASLAERLQEVAGPLGAELAAALEAGNARLLLPIGLVCEILFQGASTADPELARAAVRLEPYIGGRPLEPELARRWAETAVRVLDRLSQAQASHTIQQAGELLAELRADAFVALSSVLPHALARRLERFGQALRGALDGEVPVADAREALDAVAAHRDAAREPERMERLTMALRLLRYADLRRGAASRQPASLAALARAYAADSSFADWARARLQGGEHEPELAGALDALVGRVRGLREQENQRFASILADWSRLPNAQPDTIAVERIIEQVIAPIAVREPVLLLLVDGLDFVVFRQLLEDLRERGWEEWIPEGAAVAPVGLAVIPSVTGYSRASLFAGRVAPGAGPDEKRNFAAHPALAGVSKPKRMPRLFHKGDLTGEGTGGLADAVREAIRDPEQRVVGAVLNAVDDFLAKSEQIRPRWSVDQIALLYPILFEANLAGRAVVLASDHGHLLESGTEQLGGGTDERWRPYAEPIHKTEVVLEGPRVTAATGLPRVIVPWSEAVRYTRKKAGYHGGATPQEVVVPIAVLAPWDQGLDGWKAVPDSLPTWWSEPEPEPAAAAPPAPAPKARSRSRAAQPSLFGDAVDATPPARTWITALLQSEAYAAQRERAGRIAPPDAVVRQLLETLEQHRGRAPRSVLARAAGQPEIRLRGILAGLQRLLNMEGYPIVAVDEASGSVELNRDLLRKQFQLTV